VTPLQLWLVRHAPVDAPGICYGRHEVPVTVAPRDAAERVRAALPGRPARAVASPLARARDLGAKLADLLQIPLEVEDRLAEISMGEWEGRAFSDIERDDGERFTRWMNAWQTEAPPGGESVPDLEARVGRWLAEQRGPGAVVVLAHAGPIRAIRRLVRGATWDAVMREPVPHLAVEVIEVIEPQSDGRVPTTARETPPPTSS
jgi:alpha-ribazole phosphatase